jgi:hypothetical protein
MGIKPDVARLAEEKNIEALIEALSFKKEPKVREEAASVLGGLQDSRAVDALVRLLQDKDPHVRLAAVRALGSIQDARAVPSLLPLMKDKKDYIRWNVAEALGNIKDSRSVDALTAGLSDKSRIVRKDAAKALSRFDEHKAKLALNGYKEPEVAETDKKTRKFKLKPRRSLGEAIQFALLSGIATGIGMWYTMNRLDTSPILLFIPFYILLIAWLRPPLVQTLAIVIALAFLTYFDEAVVAYESGDDPAKVGISADVQSVQYGNMGRHSEVHVDIRIHNNRSETIQFARILVSTRSMGWVEHDVMPSIPVSQLQSGEQLIVPVRFIGSPRLNRAWVRLFAGTDTQATIANLRVEIPDQHY